LVDDLLFLFVANVHRTRTPTTGMLAKVVAHHHVMHATDESLAEFEVRIIGKLEHVRHRVLVAGDRGPRLRRRALRVLASESNEALIDRHLIAFDAVRAENRTGSHSSAERARPAKRAFRG